MSTMSALTLRPQAIESAVNKLPLQGRVMLRLLLLQYFDISREDVEYMAADRPDPRMQSGMKPALASFASKEKLQSVEDRAAQYRRFIRMRRERAWLEMEILRKLIALNSAQAAMIERQLTDTYGVPAERVRTIRQDARAAVARPFLRSLDAQWEEDTISEEDYLKERLALELQFLVRRLERERRQFDVAQREYQTVSNQPLQDHEIAHIWGIPSGALSARKAKYLSQFAASLLADGPPETSQLTPIDVWQEAFRALAASPVERSLAPYDGLERTESAFMDKAQAFVWNRIPEETQTKFWLSIVKGGSTNAVHAELGWSVFGLQRLNAVLSEIDLSPESLEQELKARLSPKPKVPAGELPVPSEAAPHISEMAEHVLNSFFGDGRSANEIQRQ